MPREFPAPQHGIVEVGIERLAVALRQEADETRIAEASAGIALQSEADGRAMTGVEQKPEHTRDIGI